MKRWRRVAPIVLGLVLVASTAVAGRAEEPAPVRAEAEAPVGTGSDETAEKAASDAPASAATGEAAADDAAPQAAPPPLILRRSPAAALLRNAWRPGRSDSLEPRVRRLRVAALELGMRNLDDAARALLLDASLGEPLERAEAAALLAPDLPAAHHARARELLRAGQPGRAFDALGDAWAALGRNLEASLWFRATLLDTLARGALWTGLLFLLLAAAWGLPRTVRGLAEVASLPVASAAAVVASLLLLPGALGEGALGVACVASFLAVAGGSLAQRATAVGAAALVLLALFPLAERLDAGLRALPAHPVLEAVHATETGLPSPLATARLEYVADREPLAQRALAVATKRSGDPGGADRRFRTLLARQPEPSAELLANAANVRLAIDDLDGAIDLYERAAMRSPSPLILFNLSQAYGRAIRLDDQDQALTDAQRLDPEAVRVLTDFVAQGEGMAVVDLALPPHELHAASDGRAATPALRARFAPGWLGGTLPRGAIVIAVLVALALVGHGPLARLQAAGEASAPLATDPSVRMTEQLARRAAQARADRLARIAGWTLPGVAAFQAGQPALALATLAAACGAVVCVLGRAGAVPDPLAAGGTGAVALVALGGLAALAYAALLAVGMLLLGRR